MSECARVSQLVPVHVLVCTFEIHEIFAPFYFLPLQFWQAIKLFKTAQIQNLFFFFTELCCLERVSIIDSNVWVNLTHGRTVFKTWRKMAKKNRGKK